MAHVSSISAAMFSGMAMSGLVTTGNAASLSSANVAAIVGAATDTARQTAAQAYFNTLTSVRQYSLFPNVRSFPAIGAPSNVVNVPVFGQKTAQTISGQANPPALDVSVNYTATDWLKGTTGTGLGNAVGDGLQRLFRFTLLAADPVVTTSATLSKFDSAAGGFGTAENSQYFWVGKLESLLVTPSLTDATTATCSMSIQSDFYGPYTSA
jgi:hypothetical protein